MTHADLESALARLEEALAVLHEAMRSFEASPDTQSSALLASAGAKLRAARLELERLEALARHGTNPTTT